jgi:hypothetical protein
MQLESKALKLYATIVTNLSLIMLDLPKVVSLASYIQDWQQAFWEIFFFHEFKPRDEVRRSKSWEQ